MLTVTKRAATAAAEPHLRLVLPFDSRTKSRLRACTQSGEEVGIFLDRGTVLRGGDLLETDDGQLIRVVAAEEDVSTVRSCDPLQLARVSYHLGNRHVPLQITATWVRYQHDHVLDKMVMGLGLGLDMSVERAAFEPEAGAYSGHAAQLHSNVLALSHPHRHG
jgi:urease accessory protein